MAFKPTSGLRAGLGRVTASAAPPQLGTPPADVPVEPPPPPLIPVKQDDAFLHLMIEHQKHGLKLSQIQVANGKRPAVTQAAKSLIIKQNATLERLKQLKGK